MSKKARRLRNAAKNEAETAKKEMDKLSKILSTEKTGRRRGLVTMLYSSNYQGKEEVVKRDYKRNYQAKNWNWPK